jgi:gamma-glutamylcyclotransferase (GGCT)/AIG2-like uncharacterized protein YtfP
VSDARVFAYGTLEVGEIVEAILGRRLPGEPATLRGYARSMVRDTHHPGIEPHAGAATPGTLYTGVDDRALAALDRFEGALYERLAVEVETARGQRVEAFAWAVRTELRSVLSGEPWDRDRFVAEHLREWLAGLSGPWRG